MPCHARFVLSFYSIGLVCVPSVSVSFHKSEDSPFRNDYSYDSVESELLRSEEIYSTKATSQRAPVVGAMVGESGHC